MCVIAAPAVAGMMLSAGAAAATYVGQQQAAKSTAAHQSRLYSETASAALEAQRFNVNQLQLRTYQETAAASREADQASRGVAQQRSTAEATIGARGLGGNTAAALIQEFDAVEADAVDVISTNLGYRVDQLRKGELSVQADTQSRIVSATPRPVISPSPVAAALQIGGALLSGYGDVAYRYQPPAYTFRGMEFRR